MLQKNLLSHQWKAFRRHPMFERNLAVRIFMFFMFGILALEFLAFGFFMDKMLLKLGTYTHAIDIFNSFLIYILIADFTVKFFWKNNQSMQIAPYLTLPIKKNRLFDFLLAKEFSSFWNLYTLFLVVPFSFKAIAPLYGAGSAFLYILFFYLACVGVSLVVALVNILTKKSPWYYILPVVLVVFPFLLTYLLKVDIGSYPVALGQAVIHFNPFAWTIFVALLVLLWFTNRIQMGAEIYRELQGEKKDQVSSLPALSFLENFGETGMMINLEFKMIMRSKRLKQQQFVLIFFFFYYIALLYYMPHATSSTFFMQLFFPVFVIGTLGLIMGQYLFTSESSFFDGMMSRRVSLYTMLQAKYLLYCSYSLVVTLLLMIPVFQQKLDFLLIISVFFYVVGVIYFLIFQNAVYNKSYIDLFDSGAFNWKGTSSNMLIITMLTMFAPLLIVVLIKLLFGYAAACGFMLVSGILFLLTHKYWLRWTYGRFQKRKYKNMEGFRSN